MPSHTNLVRRGATYYFRARVPEDLKQHYQRREFFISLKTSNPVQAEYALIHLKARLLNDFASLRGVIQPATVPPTLVAQPIPIVDAERVSLWSLVQYWTCQAERRPRTLLEVNTTVKRFLACNGDLSANAVERRHVIALKDWMLEQGRSAATVKKAMGLLSAVFELAVANDKLNANPARGIRFSKPKVERKSRVPFDADDLKRIFSSPVFSEALRSQGGKGEAAVWLPYLGLWTGARLEELGQLLVTDVRSEQGCYYLDICDEPNSDKRLKSTSSRRRVPLHPELLRLGFIDYVEQQRDAGHVRLFPLLARSGGRQLTSNWSQWFSRYLRDTVGIQDRRKVFHSFRHGFKEACRQSGIPKDIHDQLTGHASPDVGDRYGGEHYPLAPLAAAIERLSYSSFLPA
ncbi:MAG TPA: site-specific integrase [Rhodocyclaceae bacterium]|jgi:integrase